MRHTPQGGGSGSGSASTSGASTAQRTATSGSQHSTASRTTGLPPELQQEITRRLRSSSDPFESFTNQHALSATSMTYRQAVTEDRSYRELRSEVNSANELISTSSNAAITHFDIGPRVQYLSPRNRERVVEVAAGGMGNEAQQARLLASLGRGVAYFNETQRERLIDAASAINDGQSQSVALSGLRGGMTHFNPTQRTRLLNAALRNATGAIGGNAFPPAA